MTQAFGEIVSAEEKSDASAYIRQRDCPSEQNSRAATKAWFALTGGFPITTPSRCENCGLHMTGRTRYEPCRLCGYKIERQING